MSAMAVQLNDQALGISIGEGDQDSIMCAQRREAVRR
jgi:hypothetical protein